jgi:hypothetical protein
MPSANGIYTSALGGKTRHPNTGTQVTMEVITKP